MNSSLRPVTLRLTPQQLYDKGSRQGRIDAQDGMSSRSLKIDDAEERRGYRDGYRSAQTTQRSASSGGWGVYRF
ncbi:MAG: hypothetical protein PHX87_06010 [Candidatus Peribacteraceae bacterium]|nr:hypothetical protein [Candidatus Peribacteraceae bacterium]MDD5742945.1 hypothetical protein [Candidatus Peribacteraceae bacterium]